MTTRLSPMAHTYEHPRPALTVDCVLLHQDEDTTRVLLIRRAKPPFEGRWALPGGFVEEGETLHEAAARELEEETGLRVRDLRQLHAFGDPGRDPRGWVVSVAHLAVLDRAESPTAATDAAEAGWFDLEDLPPLAFDHDEMLRLAREATLRPGPTET